MPAPPEDVPFRALARYYKQRSASLRDLQKQLGVKNPQTVKDLISGETKNPNEATRRGLRQWYMRTYAEMYDMDVRDVGPPEEPRLIAIQILAEDFSTAEQKEIAGDILEMLRERYARVGRVPLFVRRLKKLIDREWP